MQLTRPTQQTSEATSSLAEIECVGLPDTTRPRDMCHLLCDIIVPVSEVAEGLLGTENGTLEELKCIPGCVHTL